MFFEFDNTWFSKIDEETWIEQNLYVFQEVSNDPEYITIFDSSRDVTLKISKSGVHVLYKNSILYKNTSTNKRLRMIKPSVFNPGSKYAVVMLYTKNFSHVCCYSEANILAYCKKHGYTAYVYRDSMTESHPTWNKPLVLLDNIKEHEYIMWIDSDAIFTNFDISLEDITNKAPDRDLLLCSDIGGWKFNAGVQIWKNTEWSLNTLRKWWNMEHVGHMQGGDQTQLIKLTTNYDPNYDHHVIFDQTVFNCHPKVHREGMYIIHMMGMSGDERIKTFKFWNSKNNV